MNAELARRHELNYVLEEVGRLKRANSFDAIFDIADDLSAWLRSRINARVSNEPAPPSALCADCPPVGYSTDKTRCSPCPRRMALCLFKGCYGTAENGGYCGVHQRTQSALSAGEKP